MRKLLIVFGFLLCGSPALAIGTHIPVWSYMGCGSSFIKSFNPGATIVQANYTYIESTDTEIGNNSHCGTSSLSAVAPASQTNTIPVYYIDPHKNYHAGTCSSDPFFNAKTNDESGWNHTSPNPVSSGTRVAWTAACGGSGTEYIPNFGDQIECVSGTNPPMCNGSNTPTNPVNAAWWKTYLSNSADFVSSNDAFFEDDTDYKLSDLFANTGQSSSLEIPTVSAMLTQEAYWNDQVAPFPMYMNYWGCSGFGASSNVTIDSTLFTLEVQTNDKMAIAENCISDTNGTDKESGVDSFVNGATSVIANAIEKIGILSQHWGSGGQDSGRREHIALVWLMMSALRPFPTKTNWVVSWEDMNGGGVSNSDTDLWPEEFIVPDTSTAILPGTNGGMRTFVQNNMAAPGSGCPNKGSPTPGFGGISDALIPTTCATGTNSKPDGAFAVEYGACWWKGIVNLGNCGAIWNHTTAAITLVAGSGNHVCVQGSSWCTYYAYTHRVTWTGLEMNYAIGGQVGCTNCTATISLPCVVGDSGVTSATNLTLPYTLAAHDAVEIVQ